MFYQTQYTDPTTGDVLMQSRWYSPTSATFRSRDTYAGNLDTPVSLNRYTYAGNNPIRYWDPTGFCFEGLGVADVAAACIPGGAGNTQVQTNFVNNNHVRDVGGGYHFQGEQRTLPASHEIHATEAGIYACNACDSGTRAEVATAGVWSRQDGATLYWSDNYAGNDTSTYQSSGPVSGFLDRAGAALKAPQTIVQSFADDPWAFTQGIGKLAAACSNPITCSAYTGNQYANEVSSLAEGHGWGYAIGAVTFDIASTATGAVAGSRTIGTRAATPTIDLYHATAAGNAQRIRAVGIDLGSSRPDLDFGPGFYLTDDLSQAQKLAARIEKNGQPAQVLHYQVPTRDLGRLGGVTFEGPGPAWEDMVRSHRLLVGPHHGLDYVSGPMVGRVSGAYGNGPIHPWGHQLSIHTQRAARMMNRNLR